MPGLTEATGSAWSYGGAIMTFAYWMILFLIVAMSLYVVFTKPSVVPGHREQTVARPIGFTPAVRLAGQDQRTAGYAPTAGPHYAVAPGEGQATAAGGEAPGPGDQAAGPGNAEAAE